MEYDLSFAATDSWRVHFSIALQAQIFIYSDYLFEAVQGVLSKKIKRRKGYLDTNSVLFYTDDENRKKSLFGLLKKSSSNAANESEEQHDFIGHLVLDHDTKVEIYNDQEETTIDAVKIKQEEEQEEQKDFDFEKVCDCYKGGRSKRRQNDDNDSKSEEQGIYKFSITPTTSQKRGKDLANKKYIFYAATERARKIWTNAIVSCVIDAISKHKEEETYDWALFGGPNRYKPFVKYLAQDSDITQIISMFNCIPITVAEKLILPLLITFDWGMGEGTF